MIIENTELLRLWLTVQLRKLCDADPSALSKYVIALIRKDKPDAELRQGMIDQLDVFLQHQTIPFVERLFICLNKREYMEGENTEGTGSGSGTPSPTKRLVPYFDTSLDTTTSSSSSGHDTSIERRDRLDMNMSASSADTVQETSIEVEELDPPTDNDLLNSSMDTTKSGDSEILASDANFKTLLSTSRGSNSSGSAASRKERIPRKKSTSPRRNRSRSRDRLRRSWSPKDYGRGRHHAGPKRSPGRRNEREGYRRRNSRNRSTSPYSRSRSPRYTSSSQRSTGSGGGGGGGGLYEPKHLRSPIKRDRSPGRSPHRDRVSRLDGMDTKGGSGGLPGTGGPDQSGRVDSAVAPKLEEYSSNGNRCKDFDERGLCMRGELCPYDHGQNPVVLQDVGVGSMKRAGGPLDSEVEHGGAIPYRAEPQDFGLVRPNRAMMNPLEDEMHHGNPMMWGGLPPFHPGGSRMRAGLMLRPPMFPMPSRELINVPVHGPPPMIEEEMPFLPMHHMGIFPQRHGGLRGRGGRGRGGMFDHSRLGGKAKVYTNCSLEVKRIPASQNTISDLNTHFVQFGKIVNIQINFEDDPEAALITYSSPAEAYAAYKSTEAVLNNRFIRVFWHNKEKENEEGDDGMGRVSAKSRLGITDFMEEGKDLGENERVLISGVNVTKTFYNPHPQKREISQEKVQAVEAIKKSQEQLAAQEQAKRAKEEKKRETIKLMHDLQKKKQVMLSEQIEQQKKLIRKLEGNKGMKPDEKDELMKLIKTLQESIETIKKGMDGPSTTLRNKGQVQPFNQQGPTNPSPLNTKEPVRDILDAELDLYNSEQEGGNTVALQQKVAELRSQAYTASNPYGVRGGRGGMRGGQVTRGMKMMRGGGTSRTVDRRPTTLIITGFPAVILPELMAHFAQFGLVPCHKPDYDGPSLTMTYENRKCAETAFGKGRVYKDHVLDIKWVSTPIQPPLPVKDKESFKNGSPPPANSPDELENREDIEV